MKEYMGKDFLLQTETAKHLYHDYAENLPIIDYHCHIPPKEIYEDRKYENISQVWLGGHMHREDGSDYYYGDHYKWRLMRANGVPEEYITGDAPDRERFQKFCETLEKTIGNPMNHWCQLELKKYFGYTKPICGKNAQEIWDLTCAKLQKDPVCTCRGLINASNVKFIGTTDDPADSLEWHAKLKKDPTIKQIIAPSFRPDACLHIEKPDFTDYIPKLAKSADMEIVSAQDVLTALSKRLDFFVEMGCRAADHGVETVEHSQAYNKPNRIEAIFRKAMAQEEITAADLCDWQSWLLYELGVLYAKKDVVMQIHYNVIRNTNTKYFNKIGADTGFDAMEKHNSIEGIRGLLDDLTLADSCPKVILYSLNPDDLDPLAVIAGGFQQDSSVPSRIQLGAPWWFGDTKDGMERQLHTLARLGVLGNFVGMLTDSRSFLSYTRHEYFRRILCNTIGNWVENGEFEDDEEILKTIVEGICYYNAAAYFNIQ